MIMLELSRMERYDEKDDPRMRNKNVGWLIMITVDFRLAKVSHPNKMDERIPRKVRIATAVRGASPGMNTFTFLAVWVSFEMR
jgi:hypothetical protein